MRKLVAPYVFEKMGGQGILDRAGIIYGRVRCGGRFSDPCYSLEEVRVTARHDLGATEPEASLLVERARQEGVRAYRTVMRKLSAATKSAIAAKSSLTKE